MYTHSFSWDNSAACQRDQELYREVYSSARAWRGCQGLLFAAWGLSLSFLRQEGSASGAGHGVSRSLHTTGLYRQTGCRWSLGHSAHAMASLCALHAWLVGSGCCQQHHGAIHHSGAGVDLMLSFISGPCSGGGSSAVHRQDVEIVYEDWRGVAAMCCVLQAVSTDSTQALLSVFKIWFPKIYPARG